MRDRQTDISPCNLPPLSAPASTSALCLGASTSSASLFAPPSPSSPWLWKQKPEHRLQPGVGSREHTPFPKRNNRYCGTERLLPCHSDSEALWKGHSLHGASRDRRQKCRPGVLSSGVCLFKEGSKVQGTVASNGQSVAQLENKAEGGEQRS